MTPYESEMITDFMEFARTHPNPSRMEGFVRGLHRDGVYEAFQDAASAFLSDPSRTKDSAFELILADAAAVPLPSCWLDHLPEFEIVLPPEDDQLEETDQSISAMLEPFRGQLMDGEVMRKIAAAVSDFITQNTYGYNPVGCDRSECILPDAYEIKIEMDPAVLTFDQAVWGYWGNDHSIEEIDR